MQKLKKLFITMALIAVYIFLNLMSTASAICDFLSFNFSALLEAVPVFVQLLKRYLRKK